MDREQKEKRILSLFENQLGMRHGCTLQTRGSSLNSAMCGKPLKAIMDQMGSQISIRRKFFLFWRWSHAVAQFFH